MIFEGEYINGKRRNGKGKEYNEDGKLRFEGDYLNGERKRKEEKREEYYGQSGYLNKEINNDNSWLLIQF